MRKMPFSRPTLLYWPILSCAASFHYPGRHCTPAFRYCCRQPYCQPGCRQPKPAGAASYFQPCQISFALSWRLAEEGSAADSQPLAGQMPAAEQAAGITPAASCRCHGAAPRGFSAIIDWLRRRDWAGSAATPPAISITRPPFHIDMYYYYEYFSVFSFHCRHWLAISLLSHTELISFITQQTGFIALYWPQ